MPKIKDFVDLSDELKNNENILDRINFEESALKNSHKPESNSKFVFDITYPSNSILQLLKVTYDKLLGKGGYGPIEIGGALGSGKSHTLLGIYHIFNDSVGARDWMNKWKVTKPELAEYIPDIDRFKDAKKLVYNFHDYTPDYLWVDIFKKLGKGSYLSMVKDYPTKSLLKEIFKDDLLLIFFDEIDRWLQAIAIDEDRLNRNLMFLEILSEVVQEKENVILYITRLGTFERLDDHLNRCKPYSVQLINQEDKMETLVSRIFKQRNLIKIREYGGKYFDYYKQCGFVEEGMRDDFLEKFVKVYPFDYSSLKKLTEVYNESSANQNLRGLFYIAPFLVKYYMNTDDYITLANLNMDKQETIEIELKTFSGSNYELLGTAKADISNTNGIPLSANIISIVLLYSVTGHHNGIDVKDIVRLLLRLNNNINDINSYIYQLKDNSQYIWEEKKDRLVLKDNINVNTVVNKNAERILQDSNRMTDIEAQIANYLSDCAGKTGIKEHGIINIYPVDEINDNSTFKFIFSTKALDTNEVFPKFYNAKTYQKSFVVISPVKTFKGINEISRNVCKKLAINELRLDDNIDKSKLDTIEKEVNTEIATSINGMKYVIYKPIDIKNIRSIDVSLNKEEILSQVFDKDAIYDDIYQLLKDKESSGYKLAQIKEDMCKFIKYSWSTPEITDEIISKMISDGKIIEEESILKLTEYKTKVEIPKQQTFDWPTGGDGHTPNTEQTHGDSWNTNEKPETFMDEGVEDTTPMAASQRLEMRLKDTDTIDTALISIKGASISDIDQFLSNISQFTENGEIELTVNLREKGMNKNDILNILDSSPTPLEKGDVKRYVGVSLKIRREKNE